MKCNKWFSPWGNGLGCDGKEPSSALDAGLHQALSVSWHRHEKTQNSGNICSSQELSCLSVQTGMFLNKHFKVAEGQDWLVQGLSGVGDSMSGRYKR